MPAYFSKEFPIVVIDNAPEYAESHTVTKLLKPQDPKQIRINDKVINPSKLSNTRNDLRYQLSTRRNPSLMQSQFINKPKAPVIIQRDNIPRPKIKRQYNQGDYDEGLYEYYDDSSRYYVDDGDDGDNPAVAESMKHEEKHEEEHEHGGGDEHHEDAHSSHGKKGEKVCINNFKIILYDLLCLKDYQVTKMPFIYLI